MTTSLFHGLFVNLYFASSPFFPFLYTAFCCYYNFEFQKKKTERSRRFVALRKRSQGTVEAKRARRKQEKVRKKKAHCGESSQARYKLCSLFMFNSTVVVPWPTRMHNAHIHTGAAWRKAS